MSPATELTFADIYTPDQYSLLALVLRTDTIIWPRVLSLMGYLSEKSFSLNVYVYLTEEGPEKYNLLRIAAPRIKPVFARKVIKPWVKEWAAEDMCDNVRVRCLEGNVWVFVPLSPRRVSYLTGNLPYTRMSKMGLTIKTMLGTGLPYRFLVEFVTR